MRFYNTYPTKIGTILIVIPCHRVIGKNKKLVGFGAGLEVKEALLDVEKNNIKNKIGE